MPPESRPVPLEDSAAVEDAGFGIEAHFPGIVHEADQVVLELLLHRSGV